MVKNPSASARDIRDAGSVPWVGKMLWRREWQPTPVFLLENPMDKGAWWAIVHRVIKNQTRLKSLTRHNPKDRGACQATVHRVTKSWKRLSD